MRSTILHSVAGAVCLAVVTWTAAQEKTDKPDKADKPAAVMTSTGDIEIGGKTLSQWMKLAPMRNNPDPATRERAVYMIGQFGKEARKQAVPTLIQCLNDKDAGVCAAALTSLEKILPNLDSTEINQRDYDDLQKGLIDNLRRGTAYARIEAAVALGQIGPLAKDALPVLARTVDDTLSWQIRKASAYAIGRVAYNPQKGPDPLAVKTLLHALKTDSCAEVRLQALSSLALLGVPKTDPEKIIQKRALGEMLNKKEGNKVILIWTNMYLAQLEAAGGSPKRVDACVNYISRELTRDPDPEHRVAAVQALGTLDSLAKPKIPLLIDTLKDPQASVATAAMTSLGQLKKHLGEADYGTIQDMLGRNQTQETRVVAAQALGNVAAKSRIPALIELLQDDEKPVANAAAGALAQMKEDLTVQQLNAIAQLLNNPKERVEVRCRAAAALGAIHQKSKIPDLVNALNDKDSDVANASVAALAAMKDDLRDNDLKVIAQLLSDKEKRVETRTYAAQALGMIGGRARVHIPELIAASKEKDLPLVLSAVVALSRFGKDANAAIPALQELKIHRDPAVKEAAAKAVDEIMGIKGGDNKGGDNKAEDKK